MTPRVLLVALLAAVFLSPVVGCDDDDPTGPSDTDAPSVVDDLRLDVRPDGSLWLQWTATGDDDTTGRASAYELRYHTAPLVAINWSVGTLLPLDPPAAGGESEEIQLGPGFSDGTWFFALRVADEEGNWSPLSAAVEISPATRPYSANTSEGQLIANLERAWVDRDQDVYQDLLSDGFQFWFAPADVELVEGSFWTRAQELEASGRIFGGQGAVWPEGDPAVESLELSLTPRDDWSDADLETVGGVTPMPAGARKCIYDVSLRVRHEGGELITQVAGSQLFYVVPELVDLAGETVTAWSLFVWRDLGADALKATEQTSWGEFKAHFADPPPVDTTGLATSEDELVGLFERAWRERNFLVYEPLIAENFQFWFAPADLDLAPNGLFWDRAYEMASTQRIFNGEVGQRPDGTIQPPVQSIQISLTPVDAEWTDAGGETVGGVTPVPASTMKRRYEVDMLVTYVQGDVVSEVAGGQLFYVQPREVEISGQPVTLWELLLWRDFGSQFKAAVESQGWGTIKALY